MHWGGLAQIHPVIYFTQIPQTQASQGLQEFYLGIWALPRNDTEPEKMVK